MRALHGQRVDTSGNPNFAYGTPADKLKKEYLNPNKRLNETRPTDVLPFGRHAQRYRGLGDPGSLRTFNPEIFGKHPNGKFLSQHVKVTNPNLDARLKRTAGSAGFELGGIPRIPYDNEPTSQGVATKLDILYPSALLLGRGPVTERMTTYNATSLLTTRLLLFQESSVLKGVTHKGTPQNPHPLQTAVTSRQDMPQFHLKLSRLENFARLNRMLQTDAWSYRPDEAGRWPLEQMLDGEAATKILSIWQPVGQLEGSARVSGSTAGSMLSSPMLATILHHGDTSTLMQDRGHVNVWGACSIKPASNRHLWLILSLVRVQDNVVAWQFVPAVTNTGGPPPREMCSGDLQIPVRGAPAPPRPVPVPRAYGASGQNAVDFAVAAAVEAAGIPHPGARDIKDMPGSASPRLEPPPPLALGAFTVPWTGSAIHVGKILGDETVEGPYQDKFNSHLISCVLGHDMVDGGHPNLRTMIQSSPAAYLRTQSAAFLTEAPENPSTDAASPTKTQLQRLPVFRRMAYDIYTITY